jgi:hypothetical protein
MTANDDRLIQSLKALGTHTTDDPKIAERLDKFHAAYALAQNDPATVAHLDALVDQADFQLRGTLVADSDRGDAAAATPNERTAPTSRKGRLRFVPRNLLVRVAGAHVDVLNNARGDVPKYTAIGAMLLTATAMAAVSAMFALKDAQRLSDWTPVLAGLVWVAIVFNVLRGMVVTTVRQRTRMRAALIAIPRILAAGVISVVVSLPLVLQVFHPEIDAELHAMEVETVNTARAKLAVESTAADAARERVDALRDIASGRYLPSIGQDPEVMAARAEVAQAQDAYDQASAGLQCQLDGTCGGTGIPGQGESYLHAKSLFDQADIALRQARAHLDSVSADAETYMARMADSKFVQRELNTLTSQLEQNERARVEALAQLDSAAMPDGLLDRLTALTRLPDRDTSVATLATVGLLLLFSLVTMLPVLTKIAMVMGRVTLYDRLLAIEEKDTYARTALNTTSPTPERDE